MTTQSPEQTSEQHPPGSPLPQKQEATTAADDSSAKCESPAPPKRTSKPKRTLTPGNILKTTANCALSFPILIRSVFSPKTSKALREKVMLGVTAINDCRFCAWGHSHWAASQGVSLEEVNQILSNQDDSLKASDPAEAAAILFGQHYAEQLDEIDPESVKNLHNYFSPAQVREIVGYVYFITFTNLSGNTVDALLDRVRGKGRPITVFEGVVGAALAPILFTLVLLVKLGKLMGDQWLSGKERQLRQSHRRLLKGVCRPNRARLRSTQERGACRQAGSCN